MGEVWVLPALLGLARMRGRLSEVGEEALVVLGCDLHGRQARLLKLCLLQSAFSSPGPSGHGRKFVFVFSILNMDAFPLLIY